jgi:hypothetical protein
MPMATVLGIVLLAGVTVRENFVFQEEKMIIQNTNKMKIKWLFLVVGMLFAAPLYPQIHLYLLADSSVKDTISPGETLILDLDISNANAEYMEICNQATLKNLENLRNQFANHLISEEYFKKEEAFLNHSIHPVSEIPVSISALITSLYIMMDNDTLPGNSYFICNANIFSGDTVVLDAKQHIRLTFGFMSEYTGKWTPGNSRFRIYVDSTVSNMVEVIVLKKLPSSMVPEDRLIKAGYFSLQCGNPKEAVQIANQILASSPGHLAALILKADASLALHMPEQALEIYQHALELFYLKHPDEYEPPDYLLLQIRALQNSGSDR